MFRNIQTVCIALALVSLALLWWSYVPQKTKSNVEYISFRIEPTVEEKTNSWKIGSNASKRPKPTIDPNLLYSQLPKSHIASEADANRDTDVVISVCRDEIDDIIKQLTQIKRSRNIFLYSKCNFTKYNDLLQSYTFSNIFLIELPNLGREGHTYLYHILHYPAVAKYTIFLQGTPKEHLFPGHNLSSFFIDEYDQKTKTYLPISGQLILYNSVHFHRIRDGFESRYFCHTGRLKHRDYDWSMVNVERRTALQSPRCFWGNENIYKWDTSKCSKYSRDIAFTGGGPYQCNLVPLIMPWLSLKQDHQLSVRNSLEITWNIIIPDLPLPHILYYSLGGQFTLSKDVITDPQLRQSYQKAFDLLSQSDNPVEGFHMELFWGYLFRIKSILHYNIGSKVNIFDCTSFQCNNSRIEN
jgi:hypothetical protein